MGDAYMKSEKRGKMNEGTQKRKLLFVKISSA